MISTQHRYWNMEPLVSCSCDDFVPITSIKEGEREGKGEKNQWGTDGIYQNLTGESGEKPFLIWQKIAGNHFCFEGDEWGGGEEKEKGNRKGKGKKEKWLANKKCCSGNHHRLRTASVLHQLLQGWSLKSMRLIIKEMAIYFTGLRPRSRQFKKPKLKGKQAFG